ncbi:protein FAM200C-like [Diabrotica undecimpunctata]|uniref:protein FAM200C-like n=1 Tax=Diabrotica undecimpunctata TaxID=50387 RepID=UPI003B6429D2
MAEIMCGQKEGKKLNSVPLSARIVKERISMLAENVKEQVIFALKQAKYFAILLDKTTDFSSNSQIMVYIRHKGADNFEEELLFYSPLELKSRGIDVYNKVNEYFNA